MRFKLSSILLLSVLFLFSCKSPSLKDMFNKTKYNDDLKSLTDKKLIKVSDRDIIYSYIIKHINDSLSINKSYENLLYFATIEDKVIRENNSKKQKLNEDVFIKITDKYAKSNVYRNGVYNNEISISGIAKNNTIKNINGFQCTLKFENSEKLIIYSGTWNVDKLLKPNSEVKIALSCGVDNGDTEIMKLKVADLHKLNISYQINKLMFDDGTSVEIF